MAFLLWDSILFIELAQLRVGARRRDGDEEMAGMEFPLWCYEQMCLPEACIRVGIIFIDQHKSMTVGGQSIGRPAQNAPNIT
jgi:hypothetical protein